MAASPQWLRYPAISPDGQHIAFTYKGDIFIVPSAGGAAQQWTSHEGHDFMPVWSPDGKQLAFASDRYGNFDVFVLNLEAGDERRLTFHSNDEFPYTFTPDGKQVLFSTSRLDDAAHRQYPTGSQPELYQVAAGGGRVDQVWTLPAEAVVFSADGQRMLYQDKKGGENEWRKKHTSAITRDIWMYEKSSGQHQQLTRFAGEDRNPVFDPKNPDFYYFLSERSGSFNVFKAPIAQEQEARPLTRFTDFPVRFLSSSADGLLCFSYDGELYTLREGEEPKRVEVSIRHQATKNADSFINVSGGVSEMAVSPDGKEIAFIARGEVFVTAVDGSMTKRLTQTPEQERFVTFSEDGKSVLYASEREGKWRIYKTEKVRAAEEPFFYASTLLKESVVVEEEQDVYQPLPSPDGKWLAYVSGRRSLRVRPMSGGASKELLGPEFLLHMRDGDQYFTWSPDSKWLLAEYNTTLANGEIVLVDVAGEKAPINITESGYSDGRPKWVNGGEQMLWFTNRDGLKGFATSGGSQRDVYTLFFTQEAFEKFNRTKEEEDLLKAIEEAQKKDKKDEKKDDKKDEDKKGTKELQIDFDDLRERKARLTIHSSSLGDAVLNKEGTMLFYLARFEKGLNLWSTDLKTKETKMVQKLDAGSGSLVWDKDMKNLYLLSGGSISKLSADASKKESIRIAGEMSVDADAERAYLYEHVVNRTKGAFYTSDMHGVDWEALAQSYEKYLPHIGNSYEFAEMLSELIGELNVSHAGARYSRSIPNADATAALGILIDYAHQGDGVKITEVLPRGPLDRAGLNIAAGHVLERIDGELLAADADWAKFLNRKAGKFVLIDVLDPATGKRSQHTVKPITLGQENALLYRRWVKKNQEEVERLSAGKLGYVHIPGMSDGPYRTIYEEMMGKYHDKEGVIVDTRFNGGGDLVADLAMFFTGEKFITYATEDRVVGYEPTFRWTKPTLALFNEANYSDGHCFACGYTDLKIGKTVGMPTPGTCSFAGWEGLSDGTRWGIVPISAKNKAGEWMENNETAPMFEVKNMPGKIDRGVDQQLEKAVEELLKDIQ